MPLSNDTIPFSSNSLYNSSLTFADIITLRNGERYVLVEDTMYGEDSCYDCDCDDIGDYNNDGTRKYGNKNYDIMKVERNGKVIFERDHLFSVTVSIYYYWTWKLTS